MFRALLRQNTLRRRTYSSIPTPTPTCAPIPHRALISITGKEVNKFLQGVIATPMPPPPHIGAGGFYSAFLSPQGRVMYDVFFHPHPTEEGGYLIDHDSRTHDAPPLLTLLKRYVLRSKVRIKAVHEEWDLWSVFGGAGDGVSEEATWRWAKSGSVEPVWKEVYVKEGVERGMVDQRAPMMGRRVLVRKGDLPKAESDHDVAPPERYTLHRVLNGVPEGIIDMPPEEAFPMEANMDIMGGVDFRKGCYVGQELTVRTYHTGAIRKRIFPVQLSPMTPGTTLPESFPPGTPIQTTITASDPPRPKPRGSGKLLTTIDDVGLALLRIEHVDSVQVGEMGMEIVSTEGEKARVLPRRLGWWPVAEFGEA